jgi:hypothetical protein
MIVANLALPKSANYYGTSCSYVIETQAYRGAALKRQTEHIFYDKSDAAILKMILLF